MTRTVAIICNGEFPRKPYPLYLIRTADVIICCDGAAAAYFRNMKRIFGPESPERQPDVIIGDLDSLPHSIAGKFGGRLIHIAEQETNDLSKAVNYAVSEIPGISKILIFGASGKREDHTIGNMALLMEFAGKFPGLDISAVSDYGTAFVITESGEIHCGEGRSVSIFTCDTSLRIKSSGLEWPTDDVIFDNWWKATLNRASADTVRLELSHPSPVLIILN